MDPFLQALAEFNWTQPEKQLEFRLYYNVEDGTPLCYSMEDLPGDFIAVDSQTFNECRFDIVVRDEKIIRVSVPQSWKLVESDSGDYVCHGNDITLIVDESCTNKKYWKAKITYESN